MAKKKSSEWKLSDGEAEMWMQHKKKKAFLLLFVGLLTYLTEVGVISWPGGSVSFALLLTGVLTFLMAIGGHKWKK